MRPTHPRPEPGRPPAEDVTDDVVVSLYVGDPRRLVASSAFDGAVAVLTPFAPARRPLRCTAEGSRRCLDDHMAWFREEPTNPAWIRARLRLAERRCEAVRGAEREGLERCARARCAGMVGTFLYQIGTMAAVVGLVATGHGFAAGVVAPLVPLPQLALLALCLRGRVDAGRP